LITSENKIEFDQISIKESEGIKLKSDFLLSYKSFDKDKSIDFTEKEVERDKTPM
jgi:hypothetical protein